MLDYLELQADGRDSVELICLYDNKSLSIGDKRNALLAAATGSYIVFLDDDDWVVGDFIEQALLAIDDANGADVIVYDIICTHVHSGKRIHCKYGIELEYNENDTGRGFWTGKPSHNMIFKRDVVKDIKFPSKNYGEDIEWAVMASNACKSQHRIERILYYYDFNISFSSRSDGAP
jgi:glycosyltransferase involved in cell wall biosynthesis